MLSNLKGRFALDEPYTYVAHLLIAVNPLKQTYTPPMSEVRECRQLSSRPKQKLRRRRSARGVTLRL